MTKQTKAIIYIRGHNEESQEVKCKLYAADKGYEILYTTRHLEDVNSCDVLLVADPSRISRNKFEYYGIAEYFNERGIEIEFALNANYKDDSIFIKEMLKGILKSI